MPTTQRSQQKQTKATQKVGGSAKKPVTKAMEGGSTKKPVTKVTGGGSTKKAVTKVVGGGSAAPSKGKTTRGGSAKGGSVKTSTTKPRQHIGGGASKTVRRGPSIKKGGSDGICYQVTTTKCGVDDCYKVTPCNSKDDAKSRLPQTDANAVPSANVNVAANSPPAEYGNMGSQLGKYGDERDVGHPQTKGVKSNFLNFFNSASSNSSNNSNRPWDMGDQLGKR